jgi:fructose-bisphosphate aldolase class I
MADMDKTQQDHIAGGLGFFAALDQSGGSTPKALAAYGIEEHAYSSEAEMFDLVHAMRTRVMTEPAFDGRRILAAILFRQTMERQVDGLPTGQYLWEDRHIVPILKIDLGLADQADGVQLMKPIDTLDELIDSAKAHGMFGTKMRSMIADADPAGITALADQQFEYGRRIAAAGLVPILEPEVSIDSPQKAAAEDLLHDRLAERLADLPAEATVMLKLSIPTRPGRYGDLLRDDRVLQVVALSGGYDRDEACARLAREPNMIASFSRALLENLRADQTDEQFSARLEGSIEQIYRASVDKRPRPVPQRSS